MGLSFLLSALAGFPASPAWGQDLEKERERPARELEAGSELEAASEEALAQKELEGPEAAYEQVLADPDNVELNYRYARAQARRGDFPGAAATLERILLVDPKLHKVRLFYALVLFRLDNLGDAERELAALKGLPMPESLRAQIRELLAQIRKRRRLTRWSASLGAGFQYDSNRNAAPSSDRRLFLDFPLPLDESARAKEDTGILLLASLRGERSLGGQKQHRVFAGATHYRSDQVAVDTLDLEASGLEAGASWGLSRGRLSSTFLFDHLSLAKQSYLRSPGARFTAERMLSPRLKAELEVGFAYQNYGPTREVPAASERSGNQLYVSLRAERVLNPGMRLAFTWAHLQKNAARRYNAYARESLGVSHTWLLGRGFFLLSSLNGERDVYDEPDPFVSRKVRHNDALRLRLSLGAPLGFVPKALGPLVWTAAYEHYRAASNITNFAYDDHKLSTMLTWRWAM